MKKTQVCAEEFTPIPFFLNFCTFNGQLFYFICFNWQLSGICARIKPNIIYKIANLRNAQFSLPKASVYFTLSPQHYWIAKAY